MESDAKARADSPPVSPERIETAHSLDDELKLEGLTLYEKKCILINREIDSHGMGRYQWCIWLLCGFGYLIDLMWAQAFGLVLSPIQQEFGFNNDQSGNISVAFSSGLTAGAFVWGVLVDIIGTVLWPGLFSLPSLQDQVTNQLSGRQWAFNLTCFISSIFGLCLGIPNYYSAFLVLTAFVGFGVGGNIPIDTTICLEFIPQNRRFLLALLSIFQPIGVVLTSAIAYGFIPSHSCQPDFSTADPLPSCRNVPDGTPCCSKSQNMGYRYLLYTLGAITLFVFFLRFVVFRFQESPKFLVYRGRDEKAIEVLHNVAKMNKRPCGITMATFESLEREHDSMASSRRSSRPMLGDGMKQLQTTWKEKVVLEFDRYKMLFDGWQMTRLTILVWLTYICDFWGFTVAGKSEATFQVLQILTSDLRILPANNPRPEEWQHLCIPPRNLPPICVHLPSWHPSCHARRSDVQRSPSRPQVDDGHQLRAHGRLALPLQHR
jgi:MFS family permease